MIKLTDSKTKETIIVNPNYISMIKCVKGHLTVVNVRGNPYGLWVEETPDQIFHMIEKQKHNLDSWRDSAQEAISRRQSYNQTANKDTY